MNAKRTFDILAAGLGLLLLAPLLALLAVAVKVGSHGPVFYRGVRVGRDGVPFRILKFRTMVPDAERLGGTSTGLHDNRVTKVGKLLRQGKLDELPQLWNVLRGDMSLVGPRPEVEEYTRLYTPEESAILSVRPGITDYSSLRFINLAEALGTDNADEVYRDRIRPVKNQLRLQYVREHTFWRDLQLLCQTVWALVRR